MTEWLSWTELNCAVKSTYVPCASAKQCPGYPVFTKRGWKTCRTKPTHPCWTQSRAEPPGDPYVAAAKSFLSCLTLWDPIDGRSPGSPGPGILQARTLEWVTISFSNAWKWKVKVKLLSRVLLLATPWTAAYQAPLSMGFSRQEYWSGLPLPSPRWPIYMRANDGRFKPLGMSLLIFVLLWFN